METSKPKIIIKPASENLGNVSKSAPENGATTTPISELNTAANETRPPVNDTANTIVINPTSEEK